MSSQVRERPTPKTMLASSRSKISNAYSNPYTTKFEPVPEAFKKSIKKRTKMADTEAKKAPKSPLPSAYPRVKPRSAISSVLKEKRDAASKLGMAKYERLSNPIRSSFTSAKSKSAKRSGGEKNRLQSVIASSIFGAEK